jgi:hypothetical protein
MEYYTEAIQETQVGDLLKVDTKTKNQCNCRDNTVNLTSLQSFILAWQWNVLIQYLSMNDDVKALTRKPITA